VLINIAFNASDALQECGRIRVRAKREAIQRKIYQTATDTLPPGNYVRIEVKDEGKGVMPKVLLRVFEPYFVAKRNGAGLSMARGFAEQSGGALMLKSAPGIDTIATLLLPRVRRWRAPRLDAHAKGQRFVPTPLCSFIAIRLA
jgi:signal transduction histidine kinase